jgi:hypothetical protein
MPFISRTPRPPYYAVVFTSINADVDHVSVIASPLASVTAPLTLEVGPATVSVPVVLVTLIRPAPPAVAVKFAPSVSVMKTPPEPEAAVIVPAVVRMFASTVPMPLVPAAGVARLTVQIVVLCLRLGFGLEVIVEVLAVEACLTVDAELAGAHEGMEDIQTADVGVAAHDDIIHDGPDVGADMGMGIRGADLGAQRIDGNRV